MNKVVWRLAHKNKPICSACNGKGNFSVKTSYNASFGFLHYIFNFIVILKSNLLYYVHNMYVCYSYSCGPKSCAKFFVCCLWFLKLIFKIYF